MIHSQTEENAVKEMVCNAIRRAFPSATFIESRDYAIRAVIFGRSYRIASISTGGYLVETIKGGFLSSDEHAARVCQTLEAAQ